MPRQYVINGPTMVRVKGSASKSAIAEVQELGLAEDSIIVTPRIFHKQVYADAAGTKVGIDRLWNLADVIVEMTLVHFSQSILEACIAEASYSNSPGKMMGNNAERWTSNNHYITVYLSSPVQGIPWRFRTAYLDDQPIMYPLGTTRTLTRLRWRAIPYQFATLTRTQTGSVNMAPVFQNTISEVRSAGTILWDYKDYTQDTSAAS